MMLPNHGMLGKAFLVTRILQVLSLLAIISICARLVAEMVENSTEPPAPFVAILSICCLAVVYVGISIVLYIDNTLPLLIATGVDTAFLIALLTASIIVGKPLSYLSCSRLGKLAASSGFTSIKDFAEGVGSNINKSPISTIAYTYTADGQIKYIQGINYAAFAGGSTSVCNMMKATWGFGIVLAITFLVSAFAMGFIWKEQRSCILLKGRNKEEPSQDSSSEV